MVEVRHFGFADSADPLNLVCWLRVIGHTVELPNHGRCRGQRFFGPWAKKRRFYVDGQRLGSQEFLDLVDEERQRRGMEPIVRRK